MSSLSLHGTDLVVFSLDTFSRYLVQQSLCQDPINSDAFEMRLSTAVGLSLG